jgi:hypothetical protein
MLPVQRIKSPLHHFNACRPELVLAAGFPPALTTLSTSLVAACKRLLVGLREQKGMEPPAGDAPARFPYKRNPQAAAWRPNGRSPQCCPGHSGRMLSAVADYGELARPVPVFAFVGRWIWYEEAWRGVENSGSQTLL